MRYFLTAFATLLALSGPSAGSEAETWAQTTGALMGMTSACGYSLPRSWIRAVVQRREALSAGPNAMDKSTAVFEDYSKRAFIQQSAGKLMTCAEVIRMAKQSEEKWGN